MKDMEKEYCMFLEKKLMQFKQYLSFTEKLKHVMCGKEINKNLSGLISKRQTCIGAIEKINASLEKIVEKGSAGLSDIQKQYKSMIDNYMSRIKDIMIQIELMDKHLAAIVVERRDGIKTELLKIQNMRQAARGYKSDMKCPARFLDTRR
jgi:F0F1-type ATP synthase membrane subunit b/b'